MTPRRAVALYALVLAVGLAVAPSAVAHSVTGRPATNYASAIREIRPAMPGLDVRLLDYGRMVRLTNHTGDVIDVLGYQSELYLRVAPDGVYQNLRSPTLYENALSPSGIALPIPTSASVTAPPEWRRVSSRPVVAWRDKRAHWGSGSAAVVRLDSSRPHVVAVWSLPLRDGPRPIEVRGEIDWTPPPPLWPWWLLAAACGLVVLTGVVWPRVPIGTVAAAGIGLVCVDIAHWLGVALAPGTTSAAVFYDGLDGGLASAVVWAVGISSAVMLRRRPRDALTGLVIAGAGVAVLGGLTDLSSLGRTHVAFALSAGSERVLIAVSIGGGLALATGAALRRARLAPADAPGGADGTASVDPENAVASRCADPS